MKREFLKGLGVDESLIDSIMQENGKDIEGLKAQLGVQKGLVTDLTGQLNTANTELGKFKDVNIDELTKERDGYKAQYEQSLKDKDNAVLEVKKEAALDSYLSTYNFSSDFAKTGIKSLISEKNLKFADGKFDGIDELMKTLTNDHADAFVSSNSNNRPSFTSSNHQTPQNTGDEAIRDKFFANNPYYKK